jgi:hypothetical protein
MGKQALRTALCAVIGGIVLTAVSPTMITWAIDLSATGSWSVQIGAADLQGSAGTDLVTSKTSLVDQIELSISGTTGPGDTWQVTTTRTVAAWHASMVLWIRRTGEGTGGAVSGGSAFQEVRATSDPFFSGEDDVASIPLQLRVTGLTVSIPPGVYSTVITLTVVDL